MEGLKETAEVRERAKVSSAIVTLSASSWCLASVVDLSSRRATCTMIKCHYNEELITAAAMDFSWGKGGNGEGVDDRTHVASERKITRARPL